MTACPLNPRSDLSTPLQANSTTSEIRPALARTTVSSSTPSWTGGQAGSSELTSCRPDLVRSEPTLPDDGSADYTLLKLWLSFQVSTAPCVRSPSTSDRWEDTPMSTTSRGTSAERPSQANGRPSSHEGGGRTPSPPPPCYPHAVNTCTGHSRQGRERLKYSRRVSWFLFISCSVVYLCSEGKLAPWINIFIRSEMLFIKRITVLRQSNTSEFPLLQFAQQKCFYMYIEIFHVCSPSAVPVFLPHANANSAFGFSPCYSECGEEDDCFLFHRANCALIEHTSA